MTATVFDTWSSDRWTSEVERSSAELPASPKTVLDMIFRQGRSYEDTAEELDRDPRDVVVQTVVGIRLIQEHLQRVHATIEPPWPRTGTGVPGAPIPRFRAVIAALERLGPTSLH